MSIKNNIIVFIFLSTFFFCQNVKAEEFNITAEEILIDKDNQTLVGTGNVEAKDTKGKIITAEKIIYDKDKEFLQAEGDVTIADTDGNFLKTNKATYDKLNELIITYENTQLLIEEGYKVTTKKILYNVSKKILSSNDNSSFMDNDGNIVESSMFEYNINNNLFSSVGKIKIIDANKNKYFFKEFHLDTKKKEMAGSDISVILDQESFGVSNESDPRFVANDIYVSKNKSKLSKGVFTVCKIRNGKCPPWSLKAKKISHDKIKKTIYYEHATLKVYDIPIFYFPKFFHPDPTVKRQSGFLAPFFTNSTALGTGFALPYYWAISNDKDITFTPKLYTKENPLLLNEYRQAFRNGFLTLDTSYTEGYNNTSKSKTNGSRNHIFADLNINLNKDDSYKSNLYTKLQQTSNNTYFRIHDINTSLVNAENTNLENEIKYSFSKNNTFFDISTNVYEDLRKKNSDKYEYIFPNILFGKSFFTEKFGSFNIQSNAFYSSYDTNKQKTFLTNDVVWQPSSYITENGFFNTFEGMLRNTNYETKKTKEYKDDKTVNEISGVVAYKTSLPLKKEGLNFSNLFSPNFMIRYAPGHMRDLDGDDTTLNYANIYSLNKTSEIEDGLSAILGFDFKINEKMTKKEKFSLSMGQVFNYEKNQDIPTKSSLDQKMSDIV